VKHLDVALAARAHRSGRALRTSAFRHRRLVRDPMAVVLWQLGAEPFTAAAIGWGMRQDGLAFAVAGDPRNRDLAFAALLKLARWFNPLFESHADCRETVVRGSHTSTRALTAPQVLVANRATVELLGRLGRRLAYLPVDGDRPAAPELVRFGRHLLFLWNHWAVPGQQLVVSFTDLLGGHWATSQSELERQSLAALDAFIEPTDGRHGFEAAFLAERDVVGPLPSGEDDERLDPLVERFHESRGGRTDPATIGPLLVAIEDHYRPLVQRSWDLLWRSRERELAYPEAPSVSRRWDEDRRAYTAHMDWMARGGLRRTRQTPRQAALTLRNLEDAKRRLEAEEACDDPLRLIPYLLENKAVRGRVIRVDREHREMGARSMVRRPLVTLHSPEPCPIPLDRELWWTEQPDGREFVVHAVIPSPAGGALVTLKLMTGSGGTGLPPIGSDACFSIHTTAERWPAMLPTDDPWTHQPELPPSTPASIEDESKDTVSRSN
jgi:hypothetical protein